MCPLGGHTKQEGNIETDLHAALHKFQSELEWFTCWKVLLGQACVPTPVTP